MAIVWISNELGLPTHCAFIHGSNYLIMPTRTLREH